MKLIALDTETTGLDLWHGCRPFFVSTCDAEGTLKCWEWDVNPYTREPLIPKKDVQEIYTYTSTAVKLFHNSKYDIRAMEFVGCTWKDWDNIHDTHIMSHCFCSAASHKLKDLSEDHCEVGKSDELALEVAVKEARMIAKREGWRIAKPLDPHWPGLKTMTNSKADEGKWWKCDMWVPRAVAKHLKYPKSHPWWTVLRQYAETDAERTILLYAFFKSWLEKEGLWDVYNDLRRSQIEPIYRMESHGITTTQKRLDDNQKSYAEKAIKASRQCFELAGGNIDNLNSPKQLQGVMFGQLGIKPVTVTKTGYSTNKDDLKMIIEEYNLQPKLSSSEVVAKSFIENLLLYRGYEKAADTVDKYRRIGCVLQAGWVKLYPNFNIPGTDTTRLSSNNPNGQNIAVKENINLRQLFGPMPGRVWFSIDYSNIELVIFAYESNDPELIDAFERGLSMHIIIARELYGDAIDTWKHKTKEGKVLIGEDAFKKSDNYSWIKNGNFSLIYGASARKANKTYRIPGAYERIRSRFTGIDQLIELKHHEVETYGYITTRGGYRLYVSQREPHKAVNYFVQGTAGLLMNYAIRDVFEYLRQWPDHKMIMTIHDELVFDFPKHPKNPQIIAHIKALMEGAGKYIDIPVTKVDVNRIKDNWSEEESYNIAI